MRINELADVRRANLQRFVDAHLGGNKTELARRVSPENPNTSYFSDLLRKGDKSFGEKAARRIEAAVGLQDRQLDIPESPLHMDANKRPQRPRLRQILADLTPEEEEELATAAIELMKRRKKRANKR